MQTSAGRKKSLKIISDSFFISADHTNNTGISLASAWHQAGGHTKIDLISTYCAGNGNTKFRREQQKATWAAASMTKSGFDSFQFSCPQRPFASSWRVQVNRPLPPPLSRVCGSTAASVISAGFMSNVFKYVWHKYATMSGIHRESRLKYHHRTILRRKCSGEAPDSGKAKLHTKKSKQRCQQREKIRL